jgi:hypothetical protein
MGDKVTKIIITSGKTIDDAPEYLLRDLAKASAIENEQLRAENQRLRHELGASILRRAISHCDEMADAPDEWYAEWNEEYYMGGFNALMNHADAIFGEVQ